MASARLYLKDPHTTAQTRVVCIIRDGRSKYLKILSDYSVSPKHWGKNQKILSANSNAVEINKQLGAFRDKVLNIYMEAKSNGKIANADFIREKLKPTEQAVSGNVQFWQVWEYYLDHKRNNFKPRSFVKFSALANHLKIFEKHNKIPLNLQTVTTDTFSRLQDFFYQEANLGTQTAAKYIELFKMFLNWAVQNGYSDNRRFQAFKAIQQPDTLKVILTKEEIAKIKEAKLGRFDSLKNARELLILSTLTGLRYSDYSRITKEHIKATEEGNKVLVIRQEKTSDFVELPLTKAAEKIVDRLLSGELHTITNQKMNKYVKEVCRIAGVDEPFEMHSFKGKMKVSKYVPKYELVTTHTGRRTFATNLLLKGIPAYTVMKFTGHRDYKSFSKYVNIPKQAEMDMVRLALVG